MAVFDYCRSSNRQSLLWQRCGMPMHSPRRPLSHKSAAVSARRAGVGASRSAPRSPASPCTQATRCREDDRHRLARLCRYVMRPAFADDQLRWDSDSRVSFERKTPWRDGTTHPEMTPVDVLERLAALVPRPRLHLIRFHGILGTQREAARPRGSDGARSRAPRARLPRPGRPGRCRRRHRGEREESYDHTPAEPALGRPAPPGLRHRHPHLPELRPGNPRAHRDDPRPRRHRPHSRLHR